MSDEIKRRLIRYIMLRVYANPLPQSQAQKYFNKSSEKIIIK